MSSRSVVISLIANVGQYVAGIRTAAAATTTMARQSQASATAASGAFTRAGGNVDKLAKGLAVGGAVMAVGLGAAVKTAADFDAKMAVVKANVHSTPAEFDRLTQAVKTQGTQFGFSALQSADAADDLAKAGLTATQIIGGGLTGALTLAAAGNISAGDAAETAATAMTMFGLASKDIPHIADLLAAGADKSTASVSSLSEGLKEGGSLAHLMGVSIEDTVAVLAEFDQSGLKGAKAGNALKTMFQNLLDPTDKQLATMKDLNLSFFDSQGKFIGLSATAGELRSKLGGLTDQQRNAALSILFGARSIQAANILYKDGAKGVEDWQKQTNDAGFAAENAAKKMDSLKGDLNKLKSAAIELAINGGAAATKFLRPLAKGATDLFSNISRLPEPVLTVGTGLLALGSGGLLAAAGVIKVVQAVQKTRTQFLAARAAVSSYTTAQIAARGAAIGTAEAQAVQNGVMAASARTFTAQGAALVTLAGGQTIAMGAFGSGVAILGRLIPGLGTLQAAYLTAATGGSKLAAAQMAAAGSAKLLGSAALVLAAGYASVKLTKYIDEQKIADVETRKLADSMKTLSSGQAAGGLADLFRESGSNISLWGHQIGAGREQVVSTSDVVKRFSSDLDAANQGSFKNFAHQLGLWGGSADSSKKRLGELDKALVQMIQTGNSAGAKKAFEALTKGMSPEQIEQARKALPGYAEAISHVVDKAKEVPSPTKAAADAIDKLGNRSKASQEDVDALTNALKGLGDAQLGARGSARSYQQAIDDATKALKDNGKTLDITTQKGRDNQEKLDGIASATTDWASAQFKLTGSMKQSNAILDTGKSRYIAMATAMGMPRAQAQALADQLFKLPKSVDTSVDVSGVDGAIFKVDKLGNLVISLHGKKVTIPADTPNAEHVAELLYSVDKAALSANGKSVRIPTAAIDSPKTMRDLLGIRGARINADGSVQIPTAALNAKENTRLLGLLGRAAVDADGKQVIIPAGTPGAKAVINLIGQIHGAQIRTNGKQVIITSRAPLAEDVRRKIDNIRGAQVATNGRSVTINSSVPNYGSTLARIRDILAAAQNKTVTINTIIRTTHVTDQLSRYKSVNADGGLYGAGGVKRMAAGGMGREAMLADRPILWAEAGPEAYIPLGRDKRNARTDSLFRTTADILGYDVIRRARHAADGYVSSRMADWRRAQPAQQQTVVVQGGNGGSGLTAEDRALLRQGIQVSQKVLAAMPAAVESGLAGRRSKDAQSAHLLRNRGGGY